MIHMEQNALPMYWDSSISTSHGLKTMNYVLMRLSLLAPLCIEIVRSQMVAETFFRTKAEQTVSLLTVWC